MIILFIFGLVLSFQVSANNLLGLPELKIPANNVQTDKKIALGKALFFDTRFSKDHSISCASCHKVDKAFTDGLTHAMGIYDQTGPRNAPTIVNAAFFKNFFHDGREHDLEHQALKPMLNPIEHGLESEQEILEVVLNNDLYKKQIQEIFVISEQEINIEHIAKAIASYERTLIAGNSPFDQYYFAGDRNQLSPSAARGLLIFRRKGNCANCHEISWNNALFSDNRFYNLGIGSAKIKPEVDRIVAGENIDQLTLSAEQRSELGRFNVTKILADIGKFKTPTLRNITLTAPYMHDGSIKTLEQVIEYYDKGGNKNKFLDAAIFPLHLSDQEKADLLAFMQSLTSNPSTFIDKF